MLRVTFFPPLLHIDQAKAVEKVVFVWKNSCKTPHNSR